MIDRSFVLTIPRLHKRLNKFQELWDNVEPIYGIDYKDMIGNVPQSWDYLRMIFLTASFLGHVKMWESALFGSGDLFLFCEDDAIPLISISSISSLVKLAYDNFDWEILKLNSRGGISKVVGSLDESKRIVIKDNWFSAVCYVAKRPAIQRFVDNLWLAAADRYLGYMTKSVAIDPPIVAFGRSSLSLLRIYL